MTSSEFARIIAVMNAFWQPVIRENAELDLWFMAIGGLRYDVTAEAIKTLTDTCTYRPTVAQIKEAIASRERGYIPSVAEAWGKITLSSYADPEYLNDLPKLTQNALKRAGGYYFLTRMAEKDAFYRFEQAYKSLAEEEKQDRLTGPMQPLLE